MQGEVGTILGDELLHRKFVVSPGTRRPETVEKGRSRVIQFQKSKGALAAHWLRLLLRIHRPPNRRHAQANWTVYSRPDVKGCTGDYALTPRHRRWRWPAARLPSVCKRNSVRPSVLCSSREHVVPRPVDLFQEVIVEQLAPAGYKTNWTATSEAAQSSWWRLSGTIRSMTSWLRADGRSLLRGPTCEFGRVSGTP
jgi:hypothetical protein